MKLHQILEGSYVIKNKDGKERRFKDDRDPAAVAWASSSSAKKSAEKYTAAWWDEKAWKDSLSATSTIYPWSKIKDDEITAQSGSIFDRAGFVNVDDWNIVRHGTEGVDGIGTAAATIRVSYSLGPEDDMGVTDRVSDSGYIRVRRDTKNPKVLVFVGYV